MDDLKLYRKIKHPWLKSKKPPWLREWQCSEILKNEIILYTISKYTVVSLRGGKKDGKELNYQKGEKKDEADIVQA